MLQKNDGSQKISGDSLKNVYRSFVTEYPIVSIEDPFDQDDWEHYAKMTAEIGEQVQIVGDDLLVTNPKASRFYYYTATCITLCVMNDRKGGLDISLFIVLAAASGESNQGEDLQCSSFEGSNFGPFLSLILFLSFMIYRWLMLLLSSLVQVVNSLWISVDD